MERHVHIPKPTRGVVFCVYVCVYEDQPSMSVYVSDLRVHVLCIGVCVSVSVSVYGCVCVLLM